MDKWNGQGLPPVGEVCKAAWLEPPDGGAMEPVAVEVVAYSNKKVWLTCCGKDEVMSIYNVAFYPSKSEAERKRDKAVDEMMRDAAACQSGRDCMQRLYDAGYRKVTPLTDEQILALPCNSEFDEIYQAKVQGAEWARSQIMGEES
jgi:hypothetical protein